MKIAVFSDLHLEFYSDPVENGPISAMAAVSIAKKVDLVVLAGDIDIGSAGILWAETMFPDVPVIYVTGNHEFYGQEILDIQEKCRDASEESDNVYYLENQTIEINGYRIFGATLWTDFKANHDQNHSKMIAGRGMNDFRIIEYCGERLRPDDTIEFFENSKRLIQEEKPDIVVTHHGPHMDVQPPQFRGGMLAPAFTSDLSDMGVPVWICGHTHFCCDFEDRGTRFVSNQAGYPHETMPGIETFDPEFIMEV